MTMNYWKGLLFMGGHLSVASVLVEAAREQRIAVAEGANEIQPREQPAAETATAIPLCPSGL